MLGIISLTNKNTLLIQGVTTMKKLLKSKKGMCLIEMVLVVAIICILASVLLYNFVGILHYLETI